MKQVININLSKDTPAETLVKVAEILNGKSQNKNDKSANDKQPLYLFNEDIEKLNKRYEELFKQVKESSNLSEKQIEKECETLSQKYDFEIELLSRNRKTDYYKKIAEIKAREDEELPVRRGWWWRLIGRWVTNRAQDIIEERAELDAEKVHTTAEKQLDDDWKRLFPKKKKISRREKRQLKKQLDAAIKEADETPTSEGFEEPAESKEPETIKQSDMEEIERYLRAHKDEIKTKSVNEIWEDIKHRIYSPKDEQKPAENVEKQEAEQAAELPEPPARKPRNKQQQQLGVETP